MQRKREEQAQMIEEFKTDPKIISAFEELKRKNVERPSSSYKSYLGLGQLPMER